MYPEDRLYSKDHEWIKVVDGIGTIGITDFAQQELGDVVFLDLPAVGRKLAAHDVMGTVESVKAVSDIYCPVGGEVTAVNAAAVEDPEKLNEDPHGEAWLVKLKLADEGELAGLMKAVDYAAFTKAASH